MELSVSALENTLNAVSELSRKAADKGIEISIHADESTIPTRWDVGCRSKVGNAVVEGSLASDFNIFSAITQAAWEIDKS